jgi:hypothetical protein
MTLAPIFFVSPYYTLITLPGWIMLGALGLQEVLFRRKKSPEIFVLVLGIMLLLFVRDPVVKDAIYYFGDGVGAVGLITLGISIIVLFTGFLLFLVIELMDRFTSTEGSSWKPQRPLTPTGFIPTARRMAQISAPILIILLATAHPLVADTLYFKYQHGRRSTDHIAILETIQSDMDDTEIILSVDEGKKFWFVRQDFIHDDPESKTRTDSTTQQWVAKNCQLERSSHRYVRRNFVLLDIYLCVPVIDDTIEAMQ